MSSREDYVASIKDAYIVISTRLSLTWVASLLPVTKFPFLSKLVNAFLEPIFENLHKFLATQTELQGFFFFIDTRVGKQGKEFEDAAFKLRGEYTKEERKKLEQEVWEKFTALASLRS